MSFTGELVAGTPKHGKLVNKNGASFEGELNAVPPPLLADDHVPRSRGGGKPTLYGAGTVVLANGKVYKHSYDDLDSFPAKLTALVTQAAYESRGATAVAKSELTPLGVWPKLAALGDEPRVPNGVSAALLGAQKKGLEKGLSVLQVKRNEQIKGLEELRAEAQTALDEEEAADAKRYAVML